MMPTVEKVLFLKRVPLFAGVPTRDLVPVAGIAEEVPSEAEERIITEGEPGSAMYLIVEGEVAIHRGDRRLAVLHPQDCFGEMSILDHEPRSASATALTDCLLLKVDQEHFHGILAQNPEVALAIIRTLTRRLRPAEPAPAAPGSSSG
jgi:CRP-like cAMP-binding protein